MCLAAQEEGLDLTGVTFIGGGEPPTTTKVQKITQMGAKLVPTYNFAETGIVGLGCARPANINDIHFFEDGLALVQYPRQVLGLGTAVDAFYFTSLLPSAPKLMLNVESDDYGVFEKRSCGCLLEDCGFTEHLRDICSFQKLTGEGVTLLGSEMVRILEEVLPAQFGGTPLDYQWLEEEDEQGFTRLTLLISPKIKIVHEKSVIDLVLKILSRGSGATSLTRAIWNQAQALRVKRMEPFSTARGKWMPLHLSHRSEYSKDASFHSPPTDSGGVPSDD